MIHSLTKKAALVCLFVLITSCSAQKTSTCSIMQTDKTDILNTKENKTECNCLCPSAGGILDIGGIIGGLLNLITSE